MKKIPNHGTNTWKTSESVSECVYFIIIVLLYSYSERALMHL